MKILDFNAALVMSKAVDDFKAKIDRLRELEHGKLNLPRETLIEIDRFYRSVIFGDNELSQAERIAVQDYYIQTL